MKRGIVLTFLLFFVLSVSADASVYIQYQNRDNKTYTFDVKIAGVSTKVEFGSNRTSSVTIEGGATECIIYTPCGEIKIYDNAKITISNGCITIN